MRIAFVESPEGLTVDAPEWGRLSRQITSVAPEALVTNEMPFGPWLAEADTFDTEAAMASIVAHEAGLAALTGLGIPIVLSSRPVRSGKKLANEGFALVDGDYRFAHQKHYFPDEPGFYESTWFRTERTGFDVVEAGKLKLGFMLCTELMINEWARHYRRQGAQLIVAPRATGSSVERWKTAAAMAAIVSGCYVVSSNRVGQTSKELTFGGKGFAFAPDGTLISETSAEANVVAFDLDSDRVAHQQSQYPCYVRETGPDAPWD